MNAKLIIYRLSSFILLPIAALNGFGIIRSLPQAVDSPLALFGAFLGATIVLYTFASFIFFIKGVQNGKMLPAYVKDLIRINAYIDVVLGAMAITCATILLLSPSIETKWVDSMAQALQSNNTGTVNRDNVVRLLQRFSIIGIIYFALLIVHIIISLQLIKKHRNLFTAAGQA